MSIILIDYFKIYKRDVAYIDVMDSGRATGGGMFRQFVSILVNCAVHIRDQDQNLESESEFILLLARWKQQQPADIVQT